MLKQTNPITSSTRGKVSICRKDLWQGPPLKSLSYGLKKTGGRSRGKITVRSIGGGHKKKYRIIDFKPYELNEEAVVTRIEYDPNRSAYIMLIQYVKSGVLRYEISCQNIKVGDKITHVSGEGQRIAPGCSLLLKHIPTGSTIYNIELRPQKGAQLIRSAGCFATLMAKEGNYCLIKLKSGEVRKINMDCRAYLGTVSNSNHQNIVLAKAGASRLRGIRPKVRGVAMNPIDHPHGGGEGKTSGGRHPCSPWGQKAKGKKTRRNRDFSMVVVKRSRKK
ncbi:50S ribosomal protein L2 [Lyticum sinuosum]|uniref:Large ribosomal subunit protein uL2 n=1 Tax=Lyticum sinuosum TaxID=1332059 RepID=A0AAE4VK07_9RICK|nr:50S ribosomal protein L2 [Lyticum sinuosum]